MARHERDFPADGAAPLRLDELLALLDGNRGDPTLTREDAIARYLSGAEGWHEAVKLLGGAFAGEGLGLKERKAD